MHSNLNTLGIPENYLSTYPRYYWLNNEVVLGPPDPYSMLVNSDEGSDLYLKARSLLNIPFVIQGEISLATMGMWSTNGDEATWTQLKEIPVNKEFKTALLLLGISDE